MILPIILQLCRLDVTLANSDSSTVCLKTLLGLIVTAEKRCWLHASLEDWSRNKDRRAVPILCPDMMTALFKRVTLPGDVRIENSQNFDCQLLHSRLTNK
jgi:hypothetical protein